MHSTFSALRMQRPAEDDQQHALEDSQWHARPHDDVLAALDSSHGGLTQAEAALRLAVHGPNALPPPPTRHPLARFLAQFHNTLIYALLAAAAAAAWLGHGLDAAVIVAVVLVNAIIG